MLHSDCKLTNVFFLHFIAETVDDATLKCVDDFVYLISEIEIKYFMKMVTPLLLNVINGTRPNWRHDLFYGRGNSVIIDGYRLHKHILWQYNLNCGYGDLTEKNRDMISRKIKNINPDNFKYNIEVLVPTIYEWLMISVGELSATCARYYLQNGGSRMAKAALKQFRKRAQKKNGM